MWLVLHGECGRLSGGLCSFLKSRSPPRSKRQESSAASGVDKRQHQDDEYVRQEISGLLEGIGDVDFEIDYMAVSNSSPFETDFAQRIKVATGLALGRDDIQWVPAISTGFTDSRFTRPLNMITYGFSGSHPDDDPMLTMAHGTDESVGIGGLDSGTKIMLAVDCSLCGAR